MSHSGKLQFKQITFDTPDVEVSSIVGYDEIKHVFNRMATYLHRHFDIPILDIERCIIESAYKWQEVNSITFKIYTELSLPETLVLADQMKKEVMKTFSSFLLNMGDYDQLTDIAEKALLYYMKEYSS